MSKAKKILAIFLALIMCVGILAACNEQGDNGKSNPGTNNSSGGPSGNPSDSSDGEQNGTETDVYKISGTVSIGYPEAETAEIQPVLEAFRNQYPNITVVEVPFAGSTGGAFNEFLTQKAASNDIFSSSTYSLSWLL